MQTFIIGRAFKSLKDHTNKELNMLPGYCSHMGSLISFSDFYARKTGDYAQELKLFRDIVKTADTTRLQQLFNVGLIYPISPGKITIPDQFTPTGNAEVTYLGKEYTYASGLPDDCEIFGTVSPKIKEEA